MVHEFETEEGQARLSRALEADYDAAAERRKEQAKFEANELKPWFDSLTDDQKDKLSYWVENYGEGSFLLGLVRMIDRDKADNDLDI